MTWAYEGDSTHEDFARYGGVQLDMYAAIVNALRAKVAVSEEIEGVIPSGTAIQNLRTSFMGDNLTRDGYHLSNNIGRLTASLTWAKAITGKDIDTLTYVPAGFRWEEEYLPAIKEAVNNAVAKPVAITAAVEGAPSTLLVPNEDLRAVATAAEYNLDDYVELPLNVIHNAYYNSGSNSTIIAGFTGKTGVIWNGENELGYELYGSPNNFELPAYHRMDVGLNFHKKTRHGFDSTTTISLYNAYNHVNPMFGFTEQHEGRMVGVSYGIIPIIPTISFCLKF